MPGYNEIRAISSILSALAAAHGGELPQGALGPVLGAYPQLDPAQLHYEWGRVQPGAPNHQVDGWVMGPAVDVGTPVVYPVYLLGLKRPSSGNDVICWVRLALYNDDGTASEGWRFELPDTPTPSDRCHSYAHAQRIVGWRKDQQGFDPFPPHPDEAAAGDDQPVNQSRPAFPLGCHSPAGLLVASIAALYGTNRTWRILENFTPQPQELVTEITEMIGASRSK